MINVFYVSGDINTSDLNSNENYNPRVAYNQSQLANVLFMRELSKKLATTGVTVNAIVPGMADTNIKRHIEAIPEGGISSAGYVTCLTESYYYY